MAQPLTDAIEALTTYANSVTGASDTTLSEAVATLANGYGGGGETTKTLTNILDANTPLVTGYLANNNTGSITAQSTASKEVTTDYIDVSSLIDQRIYFFYEMTTSNNPWLAYMWFDAEKNATMSRSVIVDVNNASLSQGTGLSYNAGVNVIASSNVITVPANAKYLRFSFRTRGSAKILALLRETFDPAEYWSRDIAKIEMINAIESDGTAKP